jgi:hypothetical protein
LILEGAGGAIGLLNFTDRFNEHILQHRQPDAGRHGTEKLAADTQNGGRKGHGLDLMIRFMDLDFIHLHGSGLPHPVEPAASTIVLADHGGVRRRHHTPMGVRHAQPEIDRRIGFLHPLQIFVDVFFIEGAIGKGSSHHANIRMTFEQQPIEFVRDFSGGQRQIFSGRLDHSHFNGAEHHHADHKRHNGHADDQDRQPGIGPTRGTGWKRGGHTQDSVTM